MNSWVLTMLAKSLPTKMMYNGVNIIVHAMPQTTRKISLRQTWMRSIPFLRFPQPVRHSGTFSSPNGMLQNLVTKAMGVIGTCAKKY